MIQVAFFFFYSVFPLLQISLLKYYGYKLLQIKVKYWQLAQSLALAWFILPAVQKWHLLLLGQAIKVVPYATSVAGASVGLNFMFLFVHLGS